MNLSDQSERLCHVEMMGPLRVTGADQTQTQFSTQKAGALLVYLALRPGPHPREQVIDLLWPEMELSAGRNNLSTTLVSLRRQLEPAGARRSSVLLATHADVGLNPETVSTDVAQFEDLLKRAARSDAPDQRAAFLQRAIGLYRGDLLPGNYQDWALREAERLRALLQEALTRLALDREALGDPAGALQAVQRSATLDPYSEEIHVHRIRLYVRTGQMALAKEAHSRFERLLSDEFGSDLSAEAREGIAQLFAHPPTPPRRRAEPFPPPALLSPVEKGLEPSAPDDLPPARSVLPIVLGRYFGREAEIVQLARLLVPRKAPGVDLDAPETPCRLVTVTGPGGMGKTRLALEFARQAGARFSFWCGFVSLADLTQAAQIPAQIVAALRLTPDRSGDPLAPVCTFLNAQDGPDHPPLLILDNLEHLLPTGETDAEITADNPALECIQTLLERVPGLILLCTSRQRLGMRGEQALALAPLPIPDALPIFSEADDLAPLLAVPSVHLYVDRARAVRPDFGLTMTNAPAVIALCRQLEGSPLALELAAAWVRALPPRKMWERLSQGLDIPAGSYADLPARHRTLSAALDWSFRLLTPAQQRLFARLAVFRGGWTLEAAEQVCDEPHNALLLLAALQEASLVTATPTSEEEEQVRYAFLETVRTFSLHELDRRGERAETQAAHLAFCVSFAERAEAQLRGAEQAQWLTLLEEEHENLRAALDACLSDRSDAEAWETGARIATALIRFWRVRGHWSEGERYVTTALARSAALPPALRARLINARASFANGAGNLALAQSLFEESLKIWRQLDHRVGVSGTLHNMGLIALLQGDYARAQPLYEESLALERESGDVQGIADALHHLGWLAQEQNDLARAQSLYEESLALRGPLNDLRGNAFTLQNMANLAYAQGEHDRAQALQEENLAIRRTLGDLSGTAAALHNLGGIALLQGRAPQALALYREALEIRRTLGDRPGLGESISNFAILATNASLWTRAARLWSAWTALHAQAGFPGHPEEEKAQQAALLLLQAKMLPAEFAAAWEAGRIWTWDQAAEAALSEN